MLPGSLAPVDVTAQIVAIFSKPSAELPRIGTRWRRMFICQPPIKEISVWDQCRNYQGSRNEPRVIKSESGFTIGDLYDLTKEVMAEHRFCLNAPPDFHDDEGIVRIDPTFTTKIILGDGDPIARARILL